MAPFEIKVTTFWIFGDFLALRIPVSNFPEFYEYNCERPRRIFYNIMLIRDVRDNFMTLVFPLSFCIYFSVCIKQLFQEIESCMS